MTCYTVPATAFIIHKVWQRKRQAYTPAQQRLSLLLLGGTIFGVVDHAWNGELFLIGPNILLDLALGVTITAVIFAVWGTMMLIEKWHFTLPWKWRHLLSR